MKPMNRLIASIVLAAAAPLSLQGCAPAVVGGTAVGITVLHDRREASAVVEDQKIELKALATISEDSSLSEHSSVGVTSYNLVVLLTGTAETAEVKGRIVGIVEGYSSVRRVLDEIAIAPRPGISEKSNDVYLTSRVKLSLFDLELPDFDPTRIKVVTENKVVYLMGLVTAEEAAAVVKRTRYVHGVKRVVKIFEYIQPQS